MSMFYPSAITNRIYELLDEYETEGLDLYNAEAGRVTGINSSTIGLVCKGKGKTAGGFVWKYKND